MKIRFRLMFAPDTDAGGGAAVATAPAGGSGSAAPDFSGIADFEPTAPGALESMINDPSTSEMPIPEKKEPAAKEPEKKEDPKPAKDPAKEPDKKGEPPVARLREAYETAKKEREELKVQLAETKKLAENHPKVAELQSSLEQAKNELAAKVKEMEQMERRLALHDPAATRKIREANDQFNKEISATLEMIPELDSEQYISLVREFSGLPRNTQEYAEKFRAFREKIRENFPDDAAEVMAAVKRGYDHSLSIGALQKQLREEAGKLAFSETRKGWEDGAKAFDADSADFLTIAEDVAASDPYNPVAWLKNVSTQDGDRFEKIKRTATDFAKGVILGPKPKTAEDFPGMSPEEVSAALQKEAEAHQINRKAAARLLVQGSMALAYIRPFFKEFQAMRERLEKLSGSNPPDPGSKGSQKAGPGGGSEDLGSYQPPTVSDSDIF